MRAFIVAAAWVLFALANRAASAEMAALPIEICRGACDASPAVAVDANHFAVGDDEDPRNALRVYRFGQPLPVSLTATDEFLRVHGETDIEGAERIGDRVYWIGSHARSSKNRPRPERHRLFSTRVSRRNGIPVLTPDGMPYVRLLDDLLSASRLERFGLARTTELPPEKAGGLNIEALGHIGSTLLVGFRSPQMNGRALVVVIQNPQELVSVPGARARLGSATLLDLGGRGVRGIATLPDATNALIAGPTDDRRDFELFGWKGVGASVRTLGNIDFGTLNPEALVVRESGAIYAVSDDGDQMVEGKPCHAWSFRGGDASRKQFRVLRLPL